jgi:hypothetical protein
MSKPLWIMVSYILRKPLTTKGSGRGNVLVLDNPTKEKSSVELYVLSDKLKTSDKRIIKAEAEATKFREQATIFYPNTLDHEIQSILKETYPTGRMFSPDDNEIAEESIQHFREMIEKNYKHTLSSKEISFSLKCFSDIEKSKISTERLEATMSVNQLVGELWQNDSHLRAIMLHAYLLRAAVSKEEVSVYTDIKHRVGEKPAQFQVYVQMLENAKILAPGGTCKLLSDNGAFAAVEEYVKKSYYIDQPIGDLDGASFLNISYDGRSGQSRAFGDAIKNTLLKHLPRLRCIGIKHQPYIFELFHPGKWLMVFACSSSTNPLKDSIVTQARGHTDKIYKSFVMRSSLPIVVGPTFSPDAISMAEATNVYLVDAGNFMFFSNFLSSLLPQEKNAIYDYLPLVFARSSGLVKMNENVEFVKRILEAS